MGISRKSEKYRSISHVQLFATTWTITCQGPLRNPQDKNIGVVTHFLLQGTLPNPGIELGSKEHSELRGIVTSF